VSVHEVGPDEGADRAELAHASDQLAAGDVHVVEGQHRHELEALGTVAAELMDPVVVGLTEGEGAAGIQVVARDERQPVGRIEDRDVHALHRHRHHLRLGVVVALDREVRCPVSASRDPTAAGCSASVPSRALAILLEVAVTGGARPSMTMAPLGPRRGRPSAPHQGADAMPELRIEVPVEEVGWLHDVHIAVDEAQSVFHGVLLGMMTCGHRDAITAPDRDGPA
jgi:hypothetical protein